MKLQGKFTKHLQISSAGTYRICGWCSSGVCEWVVSCTLRVQKKQYELCENGLRVSLHVSIILVCVCFWKYIFGKFFTIKHQSTNHQRETKMIQIAQKRFSAGKQNIYYGSVKRASKFETVANWQRKCSNICT